MEEACEVGIMTVRSTGNKESSGQGTLSVPTQEESVKILPTPPVAPILPVVTAGNLAHIDVTFRFQIAFLWFCFTLSPSPTGQARKVPSLLLHFADVGGG